MKRLTVSQLRSRAISIWPPQILQLVGTVVASTGASMWGDNYVFREGTGQEEARPARLHFT